MENLQTDQSMAQTTKNKRAQHGIGVNINVVQILQ